MVQALEAMERRSDTPDPDRTPTDDAPEAAEAADDPVIEPEDAAQEPAAEDAAAEEAALEETTPDDGGEANEHEH